MQWLRRRADWGPPRAASNRWRAVTKCGESSSSFNGKLHGFFRIGERVDEFPKSGDGSLKRLVFRSAFLSHDRLIEGIGDGRDQFLGCVELVSKALGDFGICGCYKIVETRFVDYYFAGIAGESSE